MRIKFLRAICFFAFTSLWGCAVYSFEVNPYTVSAEFVMDETSDEYNICGTNITFYNRSSRNVKSFEVVFFLFDPDGEPAQECPERLAFEIEKEIEAGNSFDFCMSLDSYMITIPQSLLRIDYLYVSRICYADGSEWEDPYGFSAFM